MLESPPNPELHHRYCKKKKEKRKEKEGMRRNREKEGGEEGERKGYNVGRERKEKKWENGRREKIREKKTPNIKRQQVFACQMNEKEEYYTCAYYRVILSLKKERNSVIWESMDESEIHCKWNKLGQRDKCSIILGQEHRKGEKDKREI